MVASIGAIASPSQGVAYYEKDGYYAKDDPAHREASSWEGKGAEALELAGPIDAEIFQTVLEGKVPGGPHLGKRDKDGEIHHRPGRDVTLSAPKSVSLMALVGGDERILAAHDRAVTRTLAWVERNAVETRMQDKASGALVHAGGQKMVAAAFRHDTSRNLDPQLHTHAVVANMVQGEDGRWRTMVNDGLYRNKMAIGAVYRSELARGLKGLGYGIEKTHPDGRFEIAGVSREVVEGFSTRRAEIEAAMASREEGAPVENPKLADRAALMTRATKRDVDKGELRQSWERQAAELGFSAEAVRGKARQSERERMVPDLFTDRGQPAEEAAAWAVAHLSERQAVFGHGDLLAAALAREPGAVAAEAAERAVAGLELEGGLHAAKGLEPGRHWTTDAAIGGDCAHAGRPGRRKNDHAGLDRGDEAPRRPAKRGAEGSGQADPLVEGPGIGGAGIRRHGQDDDAESASGARGKPWLQHDRPRSVGLRGAHPGAGIGDRVGDSPKVPRAP